MLNGKDIRKFLLTNIQPGTKLHVREIQDMIKNRFNLNEKDLEPHTSTRPTTNTHYKHRIQGVLSYLKKRGIVSHFVDSQTYLFLQ